MVAPRAAGGGIIERDIRRTSCCICPYIAQRCSAALSMASSCHTSSGQQRAVNLLRDSWKPTLIVLPKLSRLLWMDAERHRQKQHVPFPITLLWFKQHVTVESCGSRTKCVMQCHNCTIALAGQTIEDRQLGHSADSRIPPQKERGVWQNSSTGIERKAAVGSLHWKFV